MTVGGRLLPVVSISVAGNTQPTTGTVTVFNITASPALGSTATMRSVVVDFGDSSSADLGGQSGTNIPAQHVYQTAGTYRATVVAQDTNGSSNSAATLVVVQGRQPLGVSITATKDSANSTPTTIVYNPVTANVTPSGTAVSRFDWNWGDGTSTTTTSNTTSHSYTPTPGVSRTITVTATSTDGQTATNSTIVSP